MSYYTLYLRYNFAIKTLLQFNVSSIYIYFIINSIINYYYNYNFFIIWNVIKNVEKERGERRDVDHTSFYSNFRFSRNVFTWNNSDTKL